MQPEAILFDFDGTLIDSFPAHLKAYEVALAPYGIHLSAQDYFAVYAPHWYDTYEALGLPREAWAEIDAAWLAAAADHEPQLFPGVPEMLQALAKEATLGIVSAGSRPRVVADLQRTGIAGYFELILGGEDVQRPKPDPQGLLQALEALQIAPAAALYVGDAREDCAMSAAAHVPFIGVAAEFATVRITPGCRTIPLIADLPGYVQALAQSGGA